MQLVHYEGDDFAINDLINAVTVNISLQLITTQVKCSQSSPTTAWPIGLFPY